MRPAPRTRFTLASDANLRGAIHTSGDLHRQLAGLAHAAFATTFLAGNSDYRALATTLIAGGHCDHIEDRRTLANLTQTAALRTTHRVGTWLGAAAVTGWATL